MYTPVFLLVIRNRLITGRVASMRDCRICLEAGCAGLYQPLVAMKTRPPLPVCLIVSYCKGCRCKDSPRLPPRSIYVLHQAEEIIGFVVTGTQGSLNTGSMGLWFPSDSFIEAILLAISELYLVGTEVHVSSLRTVHIVTSFNV